jgi:hypothetical protein
MVGMEYLLHSSKFKAKNLPSLDERMVYWSRIETESCGMSTILESYQCGPNNSKYDLTYVLKCRVFPEEVNSQAVSLQGQIRQGLKKHSVQSLTDESFTIPRADQVDGEDWMELVKSEGGPVGVLGTTDDLDQLLARFQTFMNQSSDIEGVETQKCKTNNVEVSDMPVVIRPRVFLNIMHAIFKGEELEFPATDPYFYQEDYDLMVSSDEDADNDDDNDQSKWQSERLNEVPGLHDIMVCNLPIRFSCLYETLWLLTLLILSNLENHGRGIGRTNGIQKTRHWNFR